jgi:hypothetical protein
MRIWHTEDEVRETNVQSKPYQSLDKDIMDL